uniref:Uncharacterized protein n=1 Tax=Oryza brachyantha TaxID=4533 RepID=J3MHP1_ORYBR
MTNNRALKLLMDRYKLPISLLTLEQPPIMSKTGYVKSSSEITVIVSSYDDFKYWLERFSNRKQKLHFIYSDYTALGSAEMIKFSDSDVCQRGPQVKVVNTKLEKEKFRLLMALERQSNRISGDMEELKKQWHPKRLKNLYDMLSEDLVMANKRTDQLQQMKESVIDKLLVSELRSDVSARVRLEGLWLLKHHRPNDYQKLIVDGKVSSAEVEIVHNELESRAGKPSDTLYTIRQETLAVFGRLHMEQNLQDALGKTCLVIEQYQKNLASKKQILKAMWSYRNVIKDLIHKRSLIGCHLIDLDDALGYEYFSDEDSDDTDEGGSQHDEYEEYDEEVSDADSEDSANSDHEDGGSTSDDEDESSASSFESTYSELGEDYVGYHEKFSEEEEESDEAREGEPIATKALRRSGEMFEFQAILTNLIDIIINSPYRNSDIFLRELISNASDALDKIRFLALTDKEVLGEGDTAKLEIQIKLDKEKKILSIRDRGIGMTKEDLIKNLGTIAKSGTSAFVEKMQTGGDLNLIGKFGVGVRFYSVYLVADYFEVISKHNDDKQHVWESKADGSFAISEDTWNEPLGRGTEIRLHLRDEAKEYLEEDNLKDLVKKYSEFINFSIYLWATKEIDVEVPADVDESSEEEESPPESTEEEEREEGEEKNPKANTVKETSTEWELLNDVKAIWLRNPREVTEKEYSKFYHSLAKDFGDDKPMSCSHFTSEGDVEFKALLFVPPKAPQDLYENYYSSNKLNLKLYIRRVFISDEFDELLPKYLSFLKGIVDSDILPFNLSQEMLQQHSSLKAIKKKLLSKALDMIKKLAEEDPDEYSNKDKTDEEKSAMEEKRGLYAKFWNEFGKSIKLGIIEDATNKNCLAKLLRFESTKSEGKLASLDEYISRMKPGQNDIYYIGSKEKLDKFPLLEKLNKNNYEVIYLTPPLDDEELTRWLTRYKGRVFKEE